jgi:hypothetical protein
VAPVLADLEALALRDLGEGIRRAYRGELRRLQALLDENESVLAITIGGHFFRTGIFVVTSRKAMYGVKKWFRFYQTLVFEFDRDLVVRVSKCDIGKKRNSVLLGLRANMADSYWIGLGSDPPEPISLTKEIISLTRSRGGSVLGEERLPR